MAPMRTVLLPIISLVTVACVPVTADLFTTAIDPTTQDDAGAAGGGGNATSSSGAAGGGGSVGGADGGAGHCTDGVVSGNETGVDCGGPDCNGCPVGHTCAVGSDCASGVCAAGLCAAPTCDDGVANGDETDVDCGGPTCDKCGDHGACEAGADCYSAACATTTHECVCSLHKVVIAEVQTAGKWGQFVELWNASPQDWVPKDKMYLAADGVGATSPHYVWASMNEAPGFKVPAWRRLLIVAPGWTGPAPDAWLSSALPMAGSVRLEMVPAAGQVSYQDRMCYWQTPEQETALTWGPNTPAICMGSPAYNPADGRSLERGPGGDKGNCMHALDDAATGYVLSPETPQGLSAPPTW